MNNYQYKTKLIVFLAMIYVTCKLLCNPIFFRQTEFIVPYLNYQFKITCAILVFPLTYILSDGITVITNRKIAIIIIMFGIICDGIFSCVINFISLFSLPHQMSSTELLNTQSINNIGGQMWKLYYYGVIASAVASIFEVIIFSFLYKKIKIFFISTVISIVLIITVHNLITDYYTLSSEKDVWQIVLHNWMMNISFMLIYILLYVVAVGMYKWLKFNRTFLKVKIKK